jgi:O-succinylhomoserine sulfhydrylase
VFLESPANPTLEIIDIPAVAELAHAAGARLVVDNVFATPMLQRPLELGADVVVYSATKHIDGQGRALGGAILGEARFIDELLMPMMRHTGPSMSPVNAWIMLKGLETLELRVERHCANAAKVADFLERHDGTTRVLFPGLASHPQHDLAQRQMAGPGTIVSFEVPGGREGAFRLINALELILISNNLGDAKSLITHPATTTHQRISAEERALLGVTDGMIRLSVGLEDADDLCEDLGRGLASL